MVQPQRKDAISAGGSPERRFARPKATDPDGDARRLHRARQQLRFADVMRLEFSGSAAHARQRKVLEQLRDILTSDGRTLAQAALDALWARSERVIPIPGFKTVAQVQENVGALQYGPLGPQQMKAIADLVASSLSGDEAQPL